MNFGSENEARSYRLNAGEIEGVCVSLCAMLNRHQAGTLYLGVDRNGNIVGQQLDIKSNLSDISRALYRAIQPRFDLVINYYDTDDGEIIIINVTGTKTPYSVHGKYYFRIGSEDRYISLDDINNLYISRFSQKY